MEKQGQSFYRRCARDLTGQHISQQNEEGAGTYPSSENVFEIAGLWTIQEYIKSQRNTVMKYASKYTRSRFIYWQCEDSKNFS
jgi:hypothetical protein